MTRHVRLGSIADVPPGEGRTFQVGGVRVAVFHGRNGRIFATQAECPHRRGPLADGLLGDCTLICPLHDWTFDLLSGMALNGACGIVLYPIQRHPDGTLFLDVEEDGTPPPWRKTDYTME
jgi:nitrite reductase (NADH) small subunit